MKMGKKFFATLLAAAVAVTTLFVPATEAKAYIASSYTPYTVVENGVASTTSYDSYGIRVPAKLKLFYKGTEDISGFGIDLPEGASVTSVKSSKSKLLAVNIVRNSYSIPVNYTDTYKYTDGTTQTYSGTYTSTSSYAYIGLYPKKTGTCTFTVNIKLKNGTNVAKKVSVKIVKDASPYTITYSGETFDADGYTKTVAKSGKLKVKAGSGYKIKKIEFANTFDAAGQPIYKTIKNGKKVKLNTKKVRTVSQSSYTGTSSSGYTYSYTNKYTTPIKYSYLYPYSLVRVTYTDNFLGVTYDVDDANNDNAYAYSERIYMIK